MCANFQDIKNMKSLFVCVSYPKMGGGGGGGFR